MLYFQGFDYCTDTSKIFDAATLASVASGGRRSNRLLFSGSDTAYVTKLLPAPEGTLYLGFAHFAAIGLLPTGNNRIASVDDGATRQITISVDETGAISAYRGDTDGTLLGEGSAAKLLPNRWNYIEVKAVVHDSTGAIEVRVNGAAALTLSGVDSDVSGNAQVDRFRLHGMSCAISLDDLYANDTGFLGDVRIDTLFPDSDGTYAEGAPSTGTDHFAVVDEADPSTADYVAFDVNERELYGLTALEALGTTIHGLGVHLYAQKDDAGACEAARLLRSESTDDQGTAAVLSETPLYLSEFFTLDPVDSTAWDETKVGALEVGLKRTV